MFPSRLVIGHHGCDRTLAEAVVTRRATLHPSRNDYDWLGNGIYFWENNPHRAREWAVSDRKHGTGRTGKMREPFVIGAIIDPGNCLDLLEAESIAVVEESHAGLVRAYSAANLKVPQNTTSDGELVVRRLDCAVINHVHQLRHEEGDEAFDSVRAAFVEGAPLYGGAGFHRRTHIQICVRDSRRIMGYFKPLDLI